MPNKWVEHVKAYAKSNNLSYGCAMTEPGCKESYRKKYPKPVSKKQKQKMEMTGMSAEDKDAPAGPKRTSRVRKEMTGMSAEDKDAPAGPKRTSRVKKTNVEELQSRFPYMEFKIDKFGNTIVFYDDLDDIRGVVIKSNDKWFDFRKDDDDILSKKPKHAEFKTYASFLRQRQKMAEKGIEGSEFGALAEKMLF